MAEYRVALDIHFAVVDQIAVLVLAIRQMPSKFGHKYSEMVEEEQLLNSTAIVNERFSVTVHKLYIDLKSGYAMLSVAATRPCTRFTRRASRRSTPHIFTTHPTPTTLQKKHNM